MKDAFHNIYNHNIKWNVCTGKEYRKKGYMTLLMKHFIYLFKCGKLKHLNIDKLQFTMLP